MDKLEKLLSEYGIDWLGMADKVRLYEHLAGMDDGQIEEVLSGIAKRLDISVYADPDFKAGHMQQLRLGLEDGLDVSVYADKKLSVDQMEKSRLKLLKGLTVLSYEGAIVGYKVLKFDQTYAGRRYEVGRKYSISGQFEPLGNAFNFSEDIRGTLDRMSPRLSNIYAEVKGWGQFNVSGNEINVSDIEVVRFLPMNEFVGKIKDSKLTQVYNLYLKNPNLLAASDVVDIREQAAELGIGLNQLVNDDALAVRLKLAEQGFMLDELLNDPHPYVRMAIARRGYSLNVLIKDEKAIVRKAVAKQGYGLDVLINDKDWRVRVAVAEQGYGLDILIKDEQEDVREAAKEMLKSL